MTPFKWQELLEEGDFVGKRKRESAEYEQDGIEHLEEEKFKQIKAMPLLDYEIQSDNLDISLAWIWLAHTLSDAENSKWHLYAALLQISISFLDNNKWN